jgi:PAS domain S-box-containing protein
MKNRLDAGLDPAQGALTRFSAMALVTIGGLVLSGWLIPFPWLTRLGTTFPMAPNTALAFALAGISMGLTTVDGHRRSGPGLGFALAVVVIAVATGIEYRWGVDLKIDQILASGASSFVHTAFPGRMTPVTTFLMLVLGVSLGALHCGIRSVKRIVQPFAFLLCAGALIGLFGYAYGQESLQAVRPFKGLAVHTVAGFILASLGLIAARIHDGPARILTRRGVGGALARSLLPWALLVPSVIGWLGLEGQEAGLYGTKFGTALIVVSTMAIVGGLVLRTARVMEDADQQRLDAEQTSRRSEAKYRSLFDGMPIGLTCSAPDGRIYEANPAAVRALGYATTDALLGTNAAAHYVNAGDRDRFKELAERSDSIERFETQLKRVDGQPIWVHYNTRVVRDAAGRVDHYESSIDDVTEMIEARDNLKARSQRLLAQGQAVNAISSSNSLLLGDLERLAREITEQVSLACAAARVNVWLFSPDESELRCIDHFNAATKTHAGGMVRREPEFEKEFEALKRAPYVAAEDALNDPRTSGYADGYLRPNRITSMLDSVIEFSGRHLGLLSIEHVDRPHKWEEDEITFASQMCARIAVALSNQGTRHAEQAMRESEVRFRTVFEQAPVGITETSLDGCFLMVNRRLCEITGYTEEELRGRHFRVITHADDAERDEVHLKELVAGVIPLYSDTRRLTRKDGGGVWVSLVVTPVRDESGTIRYLASTVEDITERRRGEQELQESRQRLDGIVGSAMDAIVTVDEAYRIVLANPAAERMFGYPPSDLLGRALDLLVPPQFREGHSAQVAQFGEGGVTSRRVAESRPVFGLRRNGEIFPLEASISTDRSIGRRFYTAILRDVTERRRADEALRASVKEKQALLKEVHHRVRNNLQVISSFLSLESNRIDHHGTRAVLKDMQNRIMSMAVLHETLYRSQTFARVDMAEYLRKLTNQLTRSLLSRRSGITVHLGLEAVSLELDQSIPCGLILNELVSNALKHAFPESRSGGVWVDLQQAQEGRCRLRVRDDGVGLPTDFETRRGGSLGLQVVADLARQLNGSLTIGPGSVFDVVFTPVRTASTS